MKTSIKKSDFKNIPSNLFTSLVESSNYKTEKGLRNFLSKIDIENNERINAPIAKTISIDIVWKKSKTWGSIPHASMHVEYLNGSMVYFPDFATCSGCGYDKASTVVAECLNKALFSRLYKKRNSKNEIPLGIRIKKGWLPSFLGGCGMSCYYRVSEFLGGKMEQVVSSKTFDRYVFTF